MTPSKELRRENYLRHVARVAYEFSREFENYGSIKYLHKLPEDTPALSLVKEQIRRRLWDDVELKLKILLDKIDLFRKDESLGEFINE